MSSTNMNEEHTMSNHEGKQEQIAAYEPNITAVLCVDHYNDFLSEGGKLWPWVKEVAEEVNLLDNLRKIVRTARESNISIFHVLHPRMEPGDYENWKYPSPYQLQGARNQIFAKGSWGGTLHHDFQAQPGDIIATEHWGSSGFPNTDLDHQLKRHGKEKIIVIGLIANTCIQATARIGMELGYHVTLVRDATAARSREALHAAMDIDGPTYAHEILTSQEVIATMRNSVASRAASA
jgi:nicotinamidase-related amidase